MIVHGYGDNSLRLAKTGKNDALKLVNYGLGRWLTLPRYVPEEGTRSLLKTAPGSTSNILRCRAY